jgi:CRISPR/Cas system-associated exonuclease Cas4 (RecB family)
MNYSYTQISQYITCPRRYRYRYLDGWKEKDTRAAMLFGRAFEQALGALFRREYPGEVLFTEWSLSDSRVALFERRFLGSHATAGNHAVDALLPGRSCTGPPTAT